MKKIISLLSLFILIFASCNKSKEEKAEALIKGTLKDYLYHPDTYEPLSTTIDSAFVDLAYLESTVNYCKVLIELLEKSKEYSANIEEEEMSMNIWHDEGYSSNFSRAEYNRAKKKRDDNQALLDKVTEKINIKLSTIKDCKDKLYKDEFTGWFVSHRFKSSNGANTMSIPGEMFFICDKDFTTCKGWDTEDFNTISKLIDAIFSAENEEELRVNLLEFI